MSTTTHSPLNLMKVILNLKTQYGAYLQLWTKKYDELVNSCYELYSLDMVLLTVFEKSICETRSFIFVTFGYGWTQCEQILSFVTNTCTY